jgi:hypothetical protein
MLGHFIIVPTSANAVSCKDTTLRELKLILKNPKMHKGKNIFVYGEISEFGSSTGPGRFRAYVDGKVDPAGRYIFTLAQAHLSGSQKVLSNFVEGDYFKSCVTVTGLRTKVNYGTEVDLKVNSIKYIGGND